jgi:hypothetical protein
MTQLGLTLDIGLVAVLWWVWLGFFYWVLRRCVGYQRINTFTFFIPLLLLMNGIFVPFTRDINLLITGFEITHFDTYWMALLIMYSCLPIGVLAANMFRRSNAAELHPEDYRFKVQSPYRVKLYLLVVLGISVISIVQIVISGLQFDLIAYVSGSMSYADYAAHRYGFAEATSGLDYYLYNHLPYSIAPLSIILVWNMAEIKTWQKWAFILVLTFAVMQTGHKMPVVTIIAYLLVSRAAIRRRLVLTGKFAIGLLVLFLVTLLIILPGFYLLQGENSYLLALYWSVVRTFGEPSRALQLYFEVYPSYHDFLYGSSSRILAMIAGVKDFVPPSVYIPVEILHLNETSFPALFIGEAWADFGYVGVAGFSIVVGFLLQLYNVFYFNRKTPRLEDVALLLSIVMGSAHLLESNFFTSLLTYGIGLNFLIYLMIKGVAPAPGDRLKASLATPNSAPSL